MTGSSSRRMGIRVGHLLIRCCLSLCCDMAGFLNMVRGGNSTVSALRLCRGYGSGLGRHGSQFLIVLPTCIEQRVDSSAVGSKTDASLLLFMYMPLVGTRSIPALSLPEHLSRLPPPGLHLDRKAQFPASSFLGSTGFPAWRSESFSHGQLPLCRGKRAKRPGSNDGTG